MKMIDLIYQTECVFIYNADDWEVLRKEFRIIGQLFGSTNYIPMLPLKLLPEEALLLIDKQIGRLVTYQESVPTKEQLTKFTQDLINVEIQIYKVQRRKQVEFYIDKIMAGKRKKGDTRSKEEIIDAEVEKLQIHEKNMIWPILLHRFNKDTMQLADKDVLLTKTSVVKYETFKNLWEKKYFITSGTKFGGDFLVYNGDPCLYHAHYIVRCLSPGQKLYPSELVAMGRVATSVKKKTLISSLQNGLINYITVNWINH